jgi:Baculovirus F protein
MYKMYIALWVVFVTLGMSSHAQLTNSTNHLDKGLIFLQKDVILQGASSWTVVITVNLTSYFQQIETFRNQLDEMRPQGLNRFGEIDSEDGELMKMVDNGARHIRDYLDGLLVKITEMKDSMVGVVTRHKSTVGRIKRGLFNIGGSALNFLFGVLTENDYTDINNKIESLSGDNKEIAHVMHEQLTVVNHTYAKILETTKMVKKVDAEVSYLRKDLFQIQTSVRDELKRVKSRFIYSAQSSRVMNSYEHVADTMGADVSELRQAYTLLSTGKLHPFFLPLDTYLELADQVQVALPPGKELVTHDSTGVLRTYLSLAKITAFEYMGELRIFVEFPILQSDRLFQVYEPLPLPAPINNSQLFFAIKPQAELFAVSRNYEYYFTLSKAELAMCDHFAVTVCHISRPVMRATIPNCLFALLVGHTQAVEHLCEIHTFQDYKPVFYKPENAKHFVYSVSAKTPLAARCEKAKENRVIPAYLEGTGYLTIPASCTAHTADYVLMGTGILNMGNVRIESNLKLPNTEILPSISRLGELHLAVKPEKYKKLDNLYSLQNLSSEPTMVGLTELMAEIDLIQATGTLNRFAETSDLGHYLLLGGLCLGAAVIGYAVLAYWVSCLRCAVCPCGNRLSDEYRPTRVLFRRAQPPSQVEMGGMRSSDPGPSEQREMFLETTLEDLQALAKK